MGDLCILIPAAGASTRMRGRDKLLERVDGTPLLLRQVRGALVTGLPVLVSLPPEDTARRALLAPIRDAALRLETLADADEGMAASLRVGARWAQEHKAKALMIVLADMPEIEPRDLEAMTRAFEPGKVLRAVDAAGVAGHPVVIPARLFAALGTLTGDCGARDVLRMEEITPLPLPDQRATTDLDTPEDWADWRKRTGR